MESAPTFRAGQVGLPLLCLAAAAWLVFSPTLGAHFLDWDDQTMLVINPAVNPPTGSKLAALWRGPTNELYTPLAYTAWSGIIALERRSGNQTLDARPFHLFNLLLHTLAAWAAFCFLRELLSGISPPAKTSAAAFMGALLFLVHPLQVEPVAWVSGMNNLLCGAFCLAALWQYVLFAKGAAHARRHFVLATVLLAAALLSKPTAVVLPLLAAAVDLFSLKRPLKSVIKPIALWAIMAVPIAVVTRIFQPPQVAEVPPIWGRFWVAIDAIGFYAIKLIAPVNLTIDYMRTPRWLLSHPAAAWPGIVVLPLIGLLWQKQQWMRTGLAIALLALLPVLGLAPFDFQEYSTVTDRYMYLPMLGVALLAAQALMRARGPISWALAAAALVLLAGRAMDQTRVWNDTGALARRQLAFDPDSATGHEFMSGWLMELHQNQDAEKQCRAAIAAVQREGKTTDCLPWQVYGNLLWTEGRYAEAIQQYETALPMMGRVTKVMALTNLGIAYYRTGDLPAARDRLNQALQIQPDYPEARQFLRRMDGN